MEFNELINEIAIKYSYSEELVAALKKCVPVMAKGKNEQEIEGLIQTLKRVRIYEFENFPTEDELEAIEAEQIKRKK